MRHPMTEEELERTSAFFATQFVEASRDVLSLASAVSSAVTKWFETHKDQPEKGGD